MSYCSKRLKKYGIDEETNTFHNAIAENGVNRIDFKWFTETKNGDISINYLSPDGYVEWFNHGNSQTRRFARIRKADPGNGPKYFQKEGTESIPFCTPSIINAYKKKEKVKTLYVVEGEFKAFSLSMQNLPTMGIAGIFNFKNKEKTKMHSYIIDIITQCKVENVILIFDRDCIEIKWKEGEDSSQRPNNFYHALDCFNELIKPYDTQLYFAHVSKKCEEKGIDDVIISGKYNLADIIGELLSFTSGMPKRSFVDCYKISGVSSFKIKSIFGIASVQNFYDTYKEELEGHDFIFHKTAYFIDEKGKPQINWSGKEKQYIRVGSEYYKIVINPSPNKQRDELELVPWSTKTIHEDFSNSKEFIKQIPKFDAFTNIPENDPEKYQQSFLISKNGYTSALYNRYCLVSHVPQPGEWRNINKLLHHIFDYKNLKGEPFYEMILDYIQLLYTKPIQHLPILCLVSKEEGTGKSTFLEMLSAIFLENMRILDTERICSKFNGVWAGKLIVGVDESFIDTDKPTVVNKLKMITTNDTIPAERKSQEASEIPNFTKLIMCSNDETNFLKIGMEDTRYWVIKVKGLEEDELDPGIKDKIHLEIPAFLYYLKNRQLFYTQKNRLWFAPEDYATEALRKIQERSTPWIWKNIVYVIKQQFELQKKTSIRLAVNAIEWLMEQEKCPKVEYRKIRDAMNDHGFNTITPRTFTFYFPDDPSHPQKAKGRVYDLSYTQFFSEQEWKDIIENDYGCSSD